MKITTCVMLCEYCWNRYSIYRISANNRSNKLFRMVYIQLRSTYNELCDTCDYENRRKIMCTIAMTVKGDRITGYPGG